LSRDEILDAALQIVESDGLPRLSMPALADRLESGVTSIYWYFENKEALLAALAERVAHDLHRLLPPVGTGRWTDELVHYFAAYRDLLREHTAYLELVAYGPAATMHYALTRTAQRRLDDGLDLLVGAGLDRTAALEAFAACNNYTRGFVVLEQATLVSGAGISPVVPNGTQLDNQLEQAWDRELHVFDTFGDQQFRYGLQLLVAGIEATNRRD